MLGSVELILSFSTIVRLQEVTVDDNAEQTPFDS